MHVGQQDLFIGFSQTLLSPRPDVTTLMLRLWLFTIVFVLSMYKQFFGSTLVFMRGEVPALNPVVCIRVDVYVFPLRSIETTLVCFAGTQLIYAYLLSRSDDVPRVLVTTRCYRY